MSLEPFLMRRSSLGFLIAMPDRNILEIPVLQTQILVRAS